MIENITGMTGEHIKNIFGEYDAHAKLIERTLRVTLIQRENELKIVGEEGPVKLAKDCIASLFELSKRGNEITTQNVNYALSLTKEHVSDALVTLDDDVICHTINGKPVKPKTLGQKKYIDNIRNKMIVFGIGPAGTGKTYLAVAMAVKAFREHKISLQK